MSSRLTFLKSLYFANVQTLYMGFVHFNDNLIPKVFRLVSYSFLKFGHAILVRVLMLNFETFCNNGPFHNENGNVNCAKKSFIEKESYNCFGQKQKSGN